VVPLENQLSGLNSTLNGKLDVTQHQTRISHENDFFAAIRAAIHIDSAVEGVEFDYSALGLPPA
jgi:hypothetical protein